MYLSMLLIILIGGLSSCTDDTVDDLLPPDSKTAIVASLRVNTPGGRVYYLGAYANVPAKMDFKNMVELGSSASIYSYGENPFVWNGKSSTLTKYTVNNKLEIKVSDILSFASTGLSGGFGPPAFISETQAYFFALAEGKIIAFNPQTMKIVETINVTPLVHGNNASINTGVWESWVTADGKIIFPVAAYPKDLDAFPQYAQLAVFNSVTKAITYVEDARMCMGYDTYAKGNNGSYYYRPSRQTARAEDYSTVAGHPTTGGILKVNEDGTFDPNFFVDLKNVLNAHSVNSVVYVHDDKALVQYMEASFVPPLSPSDWYSAPAKFALVNLNTKEVEEFSSFEQYGTVYNIGKIDGVAYYGNLGASSNKFNVLKQNGAKNFEVVSEAIGGSCGFISRLR